MALDLVTITLVHRDHSNGQIRRQLHKLGADVPAHDVKPPVGVLTYALETVQLKLNITRTMRRKRQKTEACGKKLLYPQRSHSLDNIELRVHAGAPARQMDDDRYRVQADAYTGFAGEAIIPVYASREHERISNQEQRQDDEVTRDSNDVSAAPRTSTSSYTLSNNVTILDHDVPISADTVGSEPLLDDVDWADENLLGHDADEMSTEDDFDDLLLASFEEESSQQSRVAHCRRARSEGDLDQYQPARTMKRSSSLCEIVDNNNVEMNSETFTQLVDAALRLAICDTTTRLGKDLRVSNKTLTNLADIAPSLWSPGYLPAMSNRAVFLPTISHALCNVARKWNSSASLSTNLDRLAANPIYTPIATGSERVSEERIAVHLWQLLQHELYDKGAGKLTPLTCVTTSSSGVLDRYDSPFDSQGPHDLFDAVDFDAEYYHEDDFVQSDEDDLLDSMLLDDGTMIDDNGENGISSQDEDDRLELLLDEPRGEPPCLVRTNDSLTHVMNFHSPVQHRDGGEDEEDLLSIFEAEGSSFAKSVSNGFAAEYLGEHMCGDLNNSYDINEMLAI